MKSKGEARKSETDSRERREENMHKVGAEWNIAMAVFDYPEVE